MTLKIEEGKFYRNGCDEKIGPMVRYIGSHPWSGAVEGQVAVRTFREDGGWSPNESDPHVYDLMAEWSDAPPGPVRTVTRQEIVPGIYDPLIVREMMGEYPHRIAIEVRGIGDTRARWVTVDQLRQLAAHATSIADAMEAAQKDQP